MASIKVSSPPPPPPLFPSSSSLFLSLQLVPIGNVHVSPLLSKRWKGKLPGGTHSFLLCASFALLSRPRSNHSIPFHGYNPPLSLSLFFFWEKKRWEMTAPSNNHRFGDSLLSSIRSKLIIGRKFEKIFDSQNHAFRMLQVK